MKNAGLSYCERIRAVGVLSALTLCAVCYRDARADELIPDKTVEEIVVTGERAGPGMWHITRGDAHLWILGSISPLPHGITWRSKQVESVLQVTSQVLVQEPFEISVPKIFWLWLTKRDLLMVHGGRKLAEVMPADLYGRFAALRADYTDDRNKWERYRPVIAMALLEREAFHKVDLSLRLDLGAAVRILAKNHGVRVEEVATAEVGDFLEALKTLPLATENACVNASLVTIERGLPRLIERANAWANGNIDLLAALPEPKEMDACRNGLDAGAGAADLISRVRSSWLQVMEKYLQSRGTTIAVVNLDLLLEKGGLLDELRANGYAVQTPEGI